MCRVELVRFAIEHGELAVLLERGKGEAWLLPAHPWKGTGSLDAAVSKLAESGAGRNTWIDQAGARAVNRAVHVTFVAAANHRETSTHATWRNLRELPSRLNAADRDAIDGALNHLRRRIEQSPVAFRFLPPTFTLADLQQVFECVLDRRLHKASFRRTLAAAALVQATDAQRHDGRGRPAQLFKYAPRKSRGHNRALRLELHG